MNDHNGDVDETFRASVLESLEGLSRGEREVFGMYSLILRSPMPNGDIADTYFWHPDTELVVVALASTSPSLAVFARASAMAKALAIAEDVEGQVTAALIIPNTVKTLNLPGIELIHAIDLKGWSMWIVWPEGTE